MSSTTRTSAWVYAVHVSPSIVMDIAVDIKDVDAFMETFPDAIPVSRVWVADDPIEEVTRQRLAHMPRVSAV